MAIVSYLLLLFLFSAVAMEAERSVLVTVGGRNRVVRFGIAPSSQSESDKTALTAAVRSAFGDVLVEDQDFILQMKSEDWGGAFVEVMDGQTIPDKATIEAVAVQKRTEVCYFHSVISGCLQWPILKRIQSVSLMSLHRLQVLVSSW